MQRPQFEENVNGDQDSMPEPLESRSPALPSLLPGHFNVLLPRRMFIPISQGTNLYHMVQNFIGVPRKRRLSPNIKDEDMPPDKRMKLENSMTGNGFQGNGGRSLARRSRSRMRHTYVRLKDEEKRERAAARKILSANFKMLKEEIDHFQVVKHLKEKGVINDEFHQTFRKLRTRREKVEALLIKVDMLLSETKGMHVFKVFKEALHENHGNIVISLQKLPNCPEVKCTPLEQLQLCRFFGKAKDKIIATMEPRRFIDDLVTVHAIDLQQYELITKKESREERATELYNIAFQNSIIIKQLFEFNKELSSEYKKEYSTHILPSNSEATPVALRYSLTDEIPIQATTEHSDFKNEINKLEKEIVASANDNTELREDILKKTESLLERVKLGSIIFHLSTSGDTSIEKLEKCCENGTAVDWLMSILKPDDIKKLQELNANGGVLEFYIDNNDGKKQIFYEVFEECCCVLSRDFIQNHLTEFKGFLRGSELDVIKAMLTNETLDETLASQIKDSARNRDLMQKLMEILLHSELQQICFCVIEQELRKKKEYNLFQQQHQPFKKSSGEKVEDKVTIVKENIKRSVDLLEEELDARWFIEILKLRGNEACMKILTAIKRSQSRKSCTKPFVRFLCEEEDVDWFIEALYEYSPHVLAILTQSKNQTIECADTRLAMLSVYEFIIDELEPLELKSCLSTKILEQLNFLEMEKIGNRFDRTTFFMQQVLKAENLEIIQDAMVAMASKYPNIESVIKDVLTKGSLSKHYFCPRVEKHKLGMSKTIIYKANFKLPIPNAAVNSLEVLPDKQHINHASREGLSSGDNTINLSSSEMEHQNEEQSKSVFTDTNITLYDKEKMIVETKIDGDQYKETFCIEGYINRNTDMQKTMPEDENRTITTEVDSSTHLHSGLEMVDVKHTDMSTDDISPIQHDIKKIYSVDNIETDKPSSSELNQLSNGNEIQSKSVNTDTNIAFSDKEKMTGEIKIDKDQFKEKVCIESNINLHTDMQKNLPEDENRTNSTEVDQSTHLHSGLEMSDVKHIDDKPSYNIIAIPYDQIKINAADGHHTQVKHCDRKQGPKKYPKNEELNQENSKAICKTKFKQKLFLKFKEKRLDTQVSANYDAKVKNDIAQRRFKCPLEYEMHRRFEDNYHKTRRRIRFNKQRWLREKYIRQQSSFRRPEFVYENLDKQRWYKEKQFDLTRNSYEWKNQYDRNRRYSENIHSQQFCDRERSLSRFPHERGYSYPPQRWNQELYSNHPTNFNTYGGYMHQKYWRPYQYANN